MSIDESVISEYASYLALEEVLGAQRPRSNEHDEMLFVIAHQVHELWFKMLLHELAHLQRGFTSGDTAQVLHTLRRTRAVQRLITSPLDALATLTPRQFNAFRAKLGSGSGFQSAQFRQIEAVLGRRDPRMYEYFGEGTAERAGIEAAMARPSVFDSFLRYLVLHGHPVPEDHLNRDVTQPPAESEELRELLLRVYSHDGVMAQICESLAEIDQGIHEWRYRHLSMVELIIGTKPGTGGSSGAAYLRGTLFRPLFPDLWAVRSML